MNFLNRKKSFFIRPIIILVDLLIINCTVFFISDNEYLNVTFLTYINIFWLIISYYTQFYNVYRYTHITKLISLLISQFFIFSLAYLSFFSIFREGQIVNNQILIFVLIISFVVFFKFFYSFLLKKYRSDGKNYKNIVLFGELNVANKVEKIFGEKDDLGYRFFGFFSENHNKSKKYLGTISSGFEYILKNKIDEVYCESSRISKIQFTKIRNFASINNLELRIIPENKAVYSKNFILEYLGTTPILKPKPLPFEQIETHIFKRIFDIVFSFLVLFFLLSWILPLLWIVIRIDSKGSLFFKQKRDGLNGKQFICYKLRSMKDNLESDKISASKNDKRVTKVGIFLRKTSLDELPQFFNVLLGDMSVVGPRPHINVQTKKYIHQVDNYLIRHSVKPGITGLAQISGYRGEVIKKSDIENRVKLDIFYIENWSFFLDIKIIIQTSLNLIRKDEKAY
tara:strand:- start:11214 stop:12575 length:1362 start_codon:yes stop_codon:yes gene_type:complete